MVGENATNILQLWGSIWIAWSLSQHVGFETCFGNNRPDVAFGLCDIKLWDAFECGFHESFIIMLHCIFIFLLLFLLSRFRTFWQRNISSKCISIDPTHCRLQQPTLEQWNLKLHWQEESNQFEYFWDTLFSDGHFLSNFWGILETDS